MSIDDLLGLVQKYGAGAVSVAALVIALVFIYRQQIQGLKDAKTEAVTRADRLESEVKALNADLQRYLLTGYMVRQAMDEAATEMSKNASSRPDPGKSR